MGAGRVGCGFMAPGWRGSCPRFPHTLHRRSRMAPCGWRGRAASSPPRASTTWSCAKPSYPRSAPASLLRPRGLSPKTVVCKWTPKWIKWSSAPWGPRPSSPWRVSTVSPPSHPSLQNSTNGTAAPRRWATCASRGRFPSTHRCLTAGSTQRSPAMTLGVKPRTPRGASARSRWKTQRPPPSDPIEDPAFR